MNASELIKQKPHLHVFKDGTPRLISLLDNALKWMANKLESRKDAVTLETGYGLTTVLMTLLAREHHSIAPDDAGYGRVLKYCADNAIPTDGLHYYTGYSEDVLPTLPIENESLDMVLIDGGHGFPTPFVDYAYTFRKLKIGGHLVVDDIQIITGMLLKEFLLQSQEWQLIDHFDSKTSVFKKIMHTDITNWYQQPYVKTLYEYVQQAATEAKTCAIEKMQIRPFFPGK